MKGTFIGDCRKNRFNLLIFIIYAAFFGFTLVTGSPIYVNDTFQYDNQMVMREPVYGLLMHITRLISPQNYYWYVIAIQNIIAIAANTIITISIRRKFSLNKAVSLLVAVIQLAPYILTYFFSETHVVLTNSLMTEGILVSVYPLAFICLLNALHSRNPLGRESIAAIFILLMLSLIRGQMMFLFVEWLLVAFVVLLERKNKLKKTVMQMLAVILTFISVFALRSLIVCSYNYCESGMFVDTASGKTTFATNVLYVSDREDGRSIKDEKLRELFYKIYDEADEGKKNYKYAKGGIISRALYHETSHDTIKYAYLIENAKQYVGETKGIYVDQYNELIVEIDEVALEMALYILPGAFIRYLKNYISIITFGFIRSVAYVNSVFIAYAAFIYIMVVTLTVVLFIKNRNSKSAAAMTIVLIMIIGNVCATGLMINCLSRYMVYNIALFYIAGLLELVELAGLKSGGKNGIQKSEI